MVFRCQCLKLYKCCLNLVLEGMLSFPNVMKVTEGAGKNVNRIRGMQVGGVHNRYGCMAMSVWLSLVWEECYG